MTASTVVAPSATTGTMRAARITAAGEARVESVAMPAPARGSVRIRLEGSGVCSSNLPVWEGRDWFSYPQAPGAPGHEGWGVIDAVGEGVTDIAPGERVAALSYHAYAEYDTAGAGAVVRLPRTLAGMPFPGEPLGCAVNVIRRCEIEPGQTVVIVGIGFLGALLTRLAANAGARVIAISRRPFALDVARQFGADKMIPLDDHGRIIERVSALTGGEGAERVIEAVGLQWPLDLAGKLTRERGRLIIAGFHQDGPRQIDVQLWNWRGLDVINAHERDPQAYVAGITAAVEVVTSGALDPAPLLTHRFPLEQLGTAMRLTAERPEGFLKALVEP